MKRCKILMSLLVTAGLTAAVPSAARAQAGYGPRSTAANQSPLAGAKQQVKDAEAEVKRVQGTMNKIKSKVSAKFEGKEDWETAQKNLKAAEKANADAKKKALDAVHNSPEYKAQKAKLLKAEEMIAAQQGKPDSKDLQKAQQDRIDAGIAVRKLDNDAMASDTGVAEAKEKLAEARKAWDALQDELKEALAQDPEYAQAEQELATAQAQVQTAKDALAQQAQSERDARRQQQESERASRGAGAAGRRPGGYGGAGGYGGGR